MAAKQRRRKKRERTSEQDSKSCVQKLANIPHSPPPNMNVSFNNE